MCLCLLSCEIGIEKPDLRIYKILLHISELPAEEVIFVDDMEENVEAAKAVGLDAILFISHAQLLEEFWKRNLQRKTKQLLFA